MPILPKKLLSGLPLADKMNSSFCFIIWAIFGLQHSILARPFFKSNVKNLFGNKFEKYIYPFIYFLVQCIIFFAAYDLIRNLKPEVIYFTLDQRMEVIVYILNRIANIFLIVTVFHFDIGRFTGITQLLELTKKNNENMDISNYSLNTSYLYRYIRHPMYLGIILVYLTSTTVYSDIYFANVFSIIFYIDIGSYFEEKTLLRKFGMDYNLYKLKTKKFIPFIR